MKIAVLLPGMVRNFRRGCVHFQNWSKDYNNKKLDIDVYASIWDIDGKFQGSKRYKSVAEKRYFSNNKLTKGDLSDIRREFKIRKLHVENYDKWFDENKDFIKEYCEKHPNAGEQMITNGCFAQYYKIQKTFNMIDDVEKYDFIIKYRFDIKSNRLKWDEINLNEKYFYTGEMSDGDETVPTDYYFAGVPKTMEKFCNLYDYMKTVEPFEPIDYHLNHPVYTPEIFLKKYIDENDYDIYNFNVIPRRIR